eukprot:TRINITY_DN46_c0_g1_i3.p1 TRINITY_DN46_c0_g1~~TRINITY_DN46_c0_g1_i3.p1  ORF type:complete len:193 (-),score=37.79 TRINITY_DN46_c0_g1_i3:75-653(-)
MKCITLLVLLFAVAIFAQPTKPTWPKAFSASVEVDFWGEERRPHHLRWFYDQTENKDRIDGVHRWHDEYYLARTIFNHAIGKEYTVFRQMEYVTCIYRDINSTLPKPNFDNVEYRGTALIDYRTAYRWREHVDRVTLEYYDDAATREPLRIDVADERRGFVVTWKFRGVDACAQDPSVFVISPEIQAICNAV